MGNTLLFSYRSVSNLSSNTFQASSSCLFSPSQISNISGILVERVDCAKVSHYLQTDSISTWGMCILAIIEWSSMKIPHPHNHRLISLHVLWNHYSIYIYQISGLYSIFCCGHVSLTLRHMVHSHGTLKSKVFFHSTFVVIVS